MGIDVVAVLRIAELPEPPTPLGSHPVDHFGDASLINLMVAFNDADPDEHSLALRELVGEALDAHDDPRGILLFPDVVHPTASGYDAIVREIEPAGVWTPLVGMDYVPARYRGEPRRPHDELVGRMIEAMGRDAGLEFDMTAQVHKMVVASAPDRLDAAQSYKAKLAELAGVLGEDFAERYAASVQTLVDQQFGASPQVRTRRTRRR